VLVRTTASPGQLAREYKLVRRSVWGVHRARAAAVSQGDRRAADEWLDDALAEALDRIERVRIRVAALEKRGPMIVPALARRKPPPLPRWRKAPQPAPRRAGEETVLELDPIDAGHS
jgi:hypothetical protein